VSIVNNLAIAARWEGEAEIIETPTEPDIDDDEVNYYNEIGNWDD